MKYLTVQEILHKKLFYDKELHKFLEIIYEDMSTKLFLIKLDVSQGKW